MAATALSVSCPTCNALVGKSCRSGQRADRGSRRHPHVSRVEAGRQHGARLVVERLRQAEERAREEVAARAERQARGSAGIATWWKEFGALAGDFFTNCEGKVEMGVRPCEGPQEGGDGRGRAGPAAGVDAVSALVKELAAELRRVVDRLEHFADTYVDHDETYAAVYADVVKARSVLRVHGLLAGTGVCLGCLHSAEHHAGSEYMKIPKGQCSMGSHTSEERGRCPCRGWKPA